jgi:hypothetical protein
MRPERLKKLDNLVFLEVSVLSGFIICFWLVTWLIYITLSRLREFWSRWVNVKMLGNIEVVTCRVEVT